MRAERRFQTRLREWVPRWWRGEGGVAGEALRVALAPAEALYRGLGALRNRGYDLGVLPASRAPIPVVSVGNLSVGGAGKTPVAAWVAQRLLAWGHHPAVVLRGYGTDEVLVHRELNPEVPVFTSPSRIRGAEAAAGAGSDVVVLDDGFQHRALARELDLVLVSADGWTPRRRLLPRGPWREGPAALRRAGLVVITRKAAPREAADAVEVDLRRRLPAERIVRCRIQATALVPLQGEGRGAGRLATWAGEAMLAVSSLADPAPFVAHLRGLGGAVETAVYPDHHEFTARDAEALAARSRGRALVMTRKEAVKLRPLLPAGVAAWVLEQEVRFEEGEDRIENALHAALAR